MNFGPEAGVSRDIPTATELGISAELWNALAERVTQRTEGMALFSVRDRAACIAVMALDAAVDEWLVGWRERSAALPDGAQALIAAMRRTA